MNKQKKSVILLPLILFAVGLFSCQNKVTVIYNASQLISLLNSLEYKLFDATTTENLPITEDILIIGTVTISSEDLKIPEGCINKDYCRQAIGFEDNYGAEGITLTPISGDYYPPCTLTLTNVRLRFRTVLDFFIPIDEISTTPVIFLMPPSDYECQDDQIKCDVDKVCYDNYRSYCQKCLTLSQEECACQNEEGVLPDNEHCEIFQGDVIYRGTCQQGKCVTQ